MSGGPAIDRPGPDWIGLGRAPGGVVVHLYDRDHQLVSSAELYCGRDAEVWAAAHQELLGRLRAAEVALVAYDGDTGLRFTPERYRASGLTPGSVIGVFEP